MTDNEVQHDARLNVVVGTISTSVLVRGSFGNVGCRIIGSETSHSVAMRASILGIVRDLSC